MRSVAVVIQPGFAPFEFGLACEAFGLDRSDDGIPNFDFRIVSPDPGVVPSNIGFSVNVELGLDAAEDVDILILAPVPRTTWDAIDPRVIDTVRAAHVRGAWLLSVCSGAFVIAAAGVLDGKRATTHWRYADTMSRMYPRIDVDPDVLYVQSDNIITSAGTAAGLDASLHLLRQELGSELTNRIARRMVVSPQRDGGQAQFIASPLPIDSSLSLAPVTEWMLQNLDAELSVERLAARAHMSPRTFARRFKADLGATPAAWLARQRLLHAQRLLEETDLGLDRIASECGFGSAAVLRQNFARTMGLTPTAYRARFSCAGSSESAPLALPLASEPVPA
ncbi:GlxA family transcriptional regulator [Microbacterium trichothecenolyticum]|uniref:AraC family transcriptional activator FtrA n=1 Tax=Microbacterium trichothecenolyticum TaxID=69370 RepID=A0ABU0TWZ8_MICTR|nr:helix-turn-helix domain-containing protein [Microbacterium trichothecenolyticum]MDQ1124175.1 AraC family transcriptional activator FtrA [Microbacterium trichothecenolyticum]